ncbi:glycosyltransferase family 4 protein [Hyphococcus flavus]|uniref:Glycosyltransferase family 4 protein n=1 Tax=Hyphococcus flavus TaxID=1866326 RepID=A0AAE9ZDX4_9PROT|nr:glycosyltransferase family 4 protein [Hyphococcus flavus]WDI30737.1 glycosyltransferase family 4 protein [Hyphococcus flavus]
MSSQPPIRIATISNNPDPDWAWLRDVAGADFTIANRPLEWRAFSVAGKAGVENAATRFFGTRRLAFAAAKKPFDLIVSHGPWTTAWTEWFGRKGAAKHLAYSFNFTDLPTGPRKAIMRPAFNKVDAFAVFTDAEQKLYEHFFNLHESKLLRAPWGVAPPIASPGEKTIDSDYYAALGGEARDYAVLCEAARRCPGLQFVAVARPQNFDGLEVPDNLTVLFNLPFEEAWSIIWHAKAALLPLRSRETPCGLVSLVGAMHLGKAQIVTAAAGVSEYIEDEKTGLLIPPNEAEALTTAVQRLENDPALAARLGDTARTYAAAHCSEAATVAFFRGLMERWFA